MLNIRILIFLLISICWAQFTYANSLRCGNKLVLVGDTMYQVKTKCGDPDDAIHRTEMRTVTHEESEPCENSQQHVRCTKSVETSIEVIIDEWTYDFGTNRFIEKLRFENGSLASITDGDYGSKPN